MTTQSPRRLVYAFLAAGVVAACAGGSANSESERAVAPGPSTLGNYLAARHAQKERRLDHASDFFKAVLEKQPDNDAFAQRTFTLLVIEGRMAEALPLARQLEAEAAASSMADMTLVAEDLHEGRYDAALGRLDKLGSQGLNELLVPLMRAWSLQGAGRTDEALKALASLDAKSGFQTLHDLHAALINEAAGRTKASDAAFEAALGEKEHASLRLHDIAGAYFERRGKLDRARALYDSYRQRHPESRAFREELARLTAGKAGGGKPVSPAIGVSEGLFDIASSLRQRNARDTAMLFTRLALYLQPNFPFAQILLADLLEADERLNAANDIYRQIDPTSHAAWTARLRIAGNLDDMGRTDEAVAELKRMAADYPGEPDPLVSLGDVLRSHERFAEAVIAYDGALARVPEIHANHWALLYSRGIALERSDQWERAEQDFQKALELNPEQPYVLNYLGYSWIEKGRNLDRAKAMIEKAVDLRPTDGYIVDSLGWVLYRTGDLAGAVKQLERAVELRPQDPVINDHLGDAYWRVDRRREARFQWLRAKGLDPEPDVARQIEVKLKQGLTDKPAAPAK